MLTKWLRPCGLLLAGLAAVFLTVAESRAANDDVILSEQMLPPETLFFLSVPDVPGLTESWDESAYGKLLAEPKLQPFLSDVKAKLAEGSEKLKAEIGVSLEDLKELLQGDFTIAVLEKPARKISGVVMFDVGEETETLDKLIEKMDEALQQQGADHSTQDIGDIEVHVYKLAGGDDNPIKTVAYFNEEGYFAIGTEVAALKSIIDRWDGDSDETLAKQATFAYIQKQCRSGEEEPVLKWYLNPIGAVQAGIGMVQGQNPQAGLVLGMLPILGLDHLKGFGGAVGAGDDNFDLVSKNFIYVDQPATGVLGVFNFPAVEQAPPAWVSETVASYSGFNWSVDEAYSAVETIVDQFQGPGALSRVLDGLADDDSGPQIHPKKDVIDQLTGVIHLVTDAQKVDGDTPPIPSMVVAAGLKDGPAYAKTLAKLAKMDGFPGMVRDVNGTTVYDISTNDTKMSLGVSGNMLLIGTDEAKFNEAVRGKASKPLSGSADYKAIAKHFPKKTSMIGFQRSEGQAKMLYETLRNRDNDEIEGIDLKKLPEWSVIAKYFQPSGSYAVPDKKGALFVGFALPPAE
ncbi:MAG TPA: hypothetical protein VFG20_15465 [Planctomycetaceae bacterium]|nr:hypothetical protein [Planctomycetaceae bacterium]